MPYFDYSNPLFVVNWRRILHVFRIFVFILAVLYTYFRTRNAHLVV